MVSIPRSLLSLIFMICAYTAHGQTFKHRVTASLIAGGEEATVLQIPGNDHNAVLQVPNRRLFLELRPDFDVEYDWFQFFLRPRGTYEWTHTRYTALGGTSAVIKKSEKADYYLSEGFATFELTNTTAMTIGRQNYQWGPAETLSPSNFIFHETVANRGIFFEAIGRDLVRLNYTPFKALSIVTIFEFQENKDIEPYGAFNKFKPSALLKVDFSWNGGSEYAGLTLNTSQSEQVLIDGSHDSWHTRLSFGEYFNLLFPNFEGLSLYGDLGHQQGSAGWYPVKAGQENIVFFDKKYLTQDDIKTTSVVGLRYDFIDGEILRLEYSHDEHAYTPEERSLALSSLSLGAQTNPALTQKNLASYWNPGIDMRVKEGYFASLSIPNALNIRDFFVLFRGSWEPFHSSSWLYFSTEYQIGDSGTLSYSGMVTAGGTDRGLRGVKSPDHTFAYRHHW